MPPFRDSLRRLFRPGLSHGLVAVSLVFGVGLAAFVFQLSDARLTKASLAAERQDLLAVAERAAPRFERIGMSEPARLDRAAELLRELDPSIEVVSVYVPAPRRGGVRMASTDRVDQLGEVEPHDLEPVSTGRPAYEEEEERGRYRAELGYPLRAPTGDVVGVLALYQDTTHLHAALAAARADARRALALVLLPLVVLSVLLLRLVVIKPLQRIEAAAGALATGGPGTRLGGHRPDEIGALARSFDAMAEQLGAQRRSLEDLALHDPLTHLLNRRAFDERARAELARADREGAPVALLSLDLDHFKEVNDSYGHAVGDEGLRALADAMTRSTRPSDVCGRLGGDEFAVVLPGADAAAALAVARRVNASVDSALDGVPLSVSAGVAVYPGNAADLDGLFVAADHSLYASKRAGRRRGTVAGAV